MTTNAATRITVRAQLVDALSDLNYSYRQGQITREQWMESLRDLNKIGQPVDWEIDIQDVVLSHLHAVSRGHA